MICFYQIGILLFDHFSQITIDVSEDLLFDVLLDQIVGDLTILETKLLVIEPRQLFFNLLLALVDLTSRAEYVHTLRGLVEVHAYLGEYRAQILQVRGVLEEIDLVGLEMRDRLGRGHRAVLNLDVVLGQRVLDELREHRLGSRSMCCF